MRISNAFLGFAAAVALGGCCNGPVAYVDCVASGIDVNIVDELGDPSLRYATCYGGGTEEATDGPCSGFSVPFRGEGTYTIQTWSGGQLLSTDVVEASIPESRSGECCGDVFYESIAVEVPS